MGVGVKGVGACSHMGVTCRYLLPENPAWWQKQLLSLGARFTKTPDQVIMDWQRVFRSFVQEGKH